MNRLCPTCKSTLLDHWFDGGDLVPADPDDPSTIYFCSEQCKAKYKNERETKL